MKICTLFLLLLGFQFSYAIKAIIVLKEGLNTSNTIQQLNFKSSPSVFGNQQLDKIFSLSSNDTQIERELDHLGILVVDLTEREFSQMKKNRAIMHIEKDFVFKAPTPISTLSSGSQLTSSAPNTPWGIKMIQAPEAWRASSKGSGIRVMVLDTGIDRDHPDIETNFEKGRDFTGEPASRKPYTYYDSNGHGTHVAGTVLGSGAKGVYGVAPEATLLSGRVCTGYCSNSAILSGVNWAIRERVDAVNMSLGGPFASQGAAAAYRRAERAGVIIVAATGNDGQQRISYPARFASTIAVGATDQNQARAAFSNYGSELDLVAPGVSINSSVPVGTGQTSALSVNTNGTWEDTSSTPMVGAGLSKTKGQVVFVGLGKPADFLNNDVRGRIALIERGEISFEDKAKEAVSNGATGVIIFNNEPGVLNGTLSQSGSQVVNIPVVAITQASGKKLTATLSNGQTIQADVGIVAHDYAENQGTSMASPHVAGVVALVKAANPSLTPAEVKSILRRTATPLGNPLETGAGLVNALAAVKDALGVALIEDLK